MLDCNNATLVGTDTNAGITLSGYDNVIIKNCKVKDYHTGITVTNTNDNIIRNNEIKSMIDAGIYTGAAVKNLIEGNTLLDNVNGIKIESQSFYNNFKSNIITNSSIYGIRFFIVFGNIFDQQNNITQNTISKSGSSAIAILGQSLNDSIWDNNIYDTGIFYSYTTNTKYCLDGIPNHYFNGADGPECNCILLLSGLNIATQEAFCQRNLTVTQSMKIVANNLVVDCANSRINGSSVTSVFIITSQSGDTIRNCKMYNFGEGINLQGSGPLTIANNEFINGTIGILLASSISSPGSNDNIIKDNTVSNMTRGIYIITNSPRNIIRNNTIERSAFGIYYDVSTNGTLLNNTFDMNIFRNDPNYSFYNNVPENIKAENNCWGTALKSKISQSIFDFFDNNQKGIIDFDPFIVDYTNCGPGLAITDFIPIQVVQNVDLVKGKTTLVRVTVAFAENVSNSTNVSTTLYVCEWNSSWNQCYCFERWRGKKL